MAGVTNGPVTRSRARAMARGTSRYRSRSRNRNGNGNRNVNGNRSISRRGRRNRSISRRGRGNRNRRVSKAAEEDENTDEETGEIIQGFPGTVLSPEDSRVLNQITEAPEEVKLERAESLRERQLLRRQSGGEDSDLISQPSQPLERFDSAAGPVNMHSNSESELVRYSSVTQSPMRFVLYSSDINLLGRFVSTDSVQLKHNSSQNVPLDYFHVHPQFEPEVDAIKARLPASVQHIGQGFTDSQIDNALTKPNYFLLTIELDTRDGSLTGPIYGILCCSEERATVNSSRFLMPDGVTPLITSFNTYIGTPYIYVHLFTFLSERTLGYHFFTGSHMLEGLYNLFNPVGEAGRIIYLEAIDVPATLNFYDRFGMEKVPEMTLTSNIPGNPPKSVCFDPLNGLLVEYEKPYLLHNEGQIRDAAEAARLTRDTRGAATEQRVLATARQSGAPAASNNAATRVENAVYNFGISRARRDRF